MEPLLTINNLSIKYKEKKGFALKNICFTLYEGEILGIVGESGSGKTTLAYSVLNILPKETHIEGEIIFGKNNLFTLGERDLDNIRGKEIGVVFQEPKAAFNPVLSIGYQFIEFLKSKLRIKKRSDCFKKIEKLFSKVGLNDTERILKSYPHQLSGGQLQRTMIAMALSTNPRLLIADEPTSSLDVTIESQIINLLMRLQKELDLTVLFITHNLALIEILCNQVLVLYEGEIREQTTKDLLFHSPKDIYTKKLIDSFRKIT